MVCSLCTATPPCFRSAYFATPTGGSLVTNFFRIMWPSKWKKGKLVCQWTQVWWNSSFTVTSDTKHEYVTSFAIIGTNINLPVIFATYLQWNLVSWQTGLCMFSLTRSAHVTLKRMMCIFPNSCAQQMCSKCGEVDDLSIVSSDKRFHVFWAEDPVGKYIIFGSLDHSQTRFVIWRNL